MASGLSQKPTPVIWSSFDGTNFGTCFMLSCQPQYTRIEMLNWTPLRSLGMRLSSLWNPKLQKTQTNRCLSRWKKLKEENAHLNQQVSQSTPGNPPPAPSAPSRPTNNTTGPMDALLRSGGVEGLTAADSCPTLDSCIVANFMSISFLEYSPHMDFLGLFYWANNMVHVLVSVIQLPKKNIRLFGRWIGEWAKPETHISHLKHFSCLQHWEHLL